MPRTRAIAKTREVICIFCLGVNEVSTRAMSVFCAHCRKRLILEDFVVKSFQGLRTYATCGNVVVEKSGRIVASTQAQNLIVRGKVEGDVTAAGLVDVAASGTLVGNVQASGLCVERGARMAGFCEIRPVKNQPPTESTAPNQPRQPATKPRRNNVQPAAKSAKPRSRTAVPRSGTTKVKAISTRRRPAS